MRVSLQGSHISPEAARLFPKDWVQPVAPEISDWLIWVWRAWQRLTLDRPMHGGGLGAVMPGRIPWQSVRDWAEQHGQDLAFLDQAVVAMDTVFLEWSAERMKTT